MHERTTAQVASASVGFMVLFGFAALACDRAPAAEVAPHHASSVAAPRGISTGTTRPSTPTLVSTKSESSDISSASLDAGPRYGPQTLAYVTLDRELFPDLPGQREVRATTCAGATEPEACLIGARYTDSAAREIALDLWRRRGVATGVVGAHVMDGGFRGMIQLVPHVPEGVERKHLTWVRSALDEIDSVYAAARTHAGRTGPAPRYRSAGFTFLFMESVGRTTPSATALDWRISYNVRGSLLQSASGVRDTLVHEIFHLNDQAHQDASGRLLAREFDAIRQRCGISTPCLAPYAPGDTMVRNSTFYAFHPGNGVGEYAAELAVRHFRETARALGLTSLAGPRVKPFKCATPENQRAWQSFLDEFFDGVDVTPPCAR
jgi:hypothetical protein